MSYAEDASGFAFDATAPFTIEECVRAIAKDGEYNARRASNAKRGLEEHPNLYQLDDLRYAPRCHFFNNAQFRILPQPEEIEQGVLYPGHRFIPFAHPLAVPDTFEVIDEASQAIRYRPIVNTLDEIAIYHSLIPLAQIPVLDVLSEEDVMPPTVKLKVLDMADWYERHGFREGDSIIATVLDLHDGRYQFRYSPLADMESDFMRIRRSDIALEEALVAVATECFAEIPLDTQVFHAFVIAGEDLLQSPGQHLGGILTSSENVEWTNDGYTCYLHPPGRDPHQSLIEQAARSHPMPTGKGNTVDAILEDVGIAVTMAEVRALIRTATSDWDADDADAEAEAKQDVLDDVLPHNWDSIMTPRQAIAFHESFDKLWIKTAKQERQHPTPLPLAHLRREVLDLQREIRNLLRDMDEASVDICDLPADRMVHLAQIDRMMADLLETMEDDADAAQFASSLSQQIVGLAANVQDIVDSVRVDMDLT